MRPRFQLVVSKDHLDLFYFLRIAPRRALIAVVKWSLMILRTGAIQLMEAAPHRKV
jgi:hypothetical protein